MHAESFLKRLQNRYADHFRQDLRGLGAQKENGRDRPAVRAASSFLAYRFRPAAGRAAFAPLAGAELNVRTGADTRAAATGPAVDVRRICGGTTRGAGGVAILGVGVAIVRCCRTGPEFTIFEPDVVGVKLRASLTIFGDVPPELVAPRKLGSPLMICGPLDAWEPAVKRSDPA